jgi:hypothetical protein
VKSAHAFAAPVEKPTGGGFVQSAQYQPRGTAIVSSGNSHRKVAGWSDAGSAATSASPSNDAHWKRHAIANLATIAIERASERSHDCGVGRQPVRRFPSLVAEIRRLSCSKWRTACADECILPGSSIAWRRFTRGSEKCNLRSAGSCKRWNWSG